MSEETIDYEALCGRLVAENEKLRRVLSTPGGPMAWSIGTHLAKLQEFIENNYLVLMFLLFVACSVCGGLYTLWRDRRGHE